jgi:NAD+ kinase
VSLIRIPSCQYLITALPEGDHIKVTASKYPFPTVCADRQSTDWFNSISRTLKWNERERQKSFVVVEEGPSRKSSTTSIKRKESVATGLENDIEEESPEEVAEEEVGYEEDEEDEKYDIDVTSPTSSKAEEATIPNSVTPEEVERARHKVESQNVDADERASIASALAKSVRMAGLSDTRFSETGVESPSRFSGPAPHPPKVSPRHTLNGMSQMASTHSADSTASTFHTHDGEEGQRDHIHNPRSTLSGARSRIPREREREAEREADLDTTNMKTPKANHAARHAVSPRQLYSNAQQSNVGHRERGHRRSHSHDAPRVRLPSPGAPTFQRRAFAVWGHDESEASDSDNN